MRVVALWGSLYGSKTDPTAVALLTCVLFRSYKTFAQNATKDMGNSVRDRT